MLECGGGESDQENVTPVNNALVAAEEDMMEMTAAGPYQAVL